MISSTTTGVHVVVKFDLERLAVVEGQGAVDAASVDRLLGVVHCAQDISGRSVALDLCAATVTPEALTQLPAASAELAADGHGFDLRSGYAPDDPLGPTGQIHVDGP